MMQMVAIAIGGYAIMAIKAGLGNVRVAKLADDPRYRVQGENRQVLLDQVVVWLIAFFLQSLVDAMISRSVSFTVGGMCH